MYRLHHLKIQQIKIILRMLCTQQPNTVLSWDLRWSQILSKQLSCLFTYNLSIEGHNFRIFFSISFPHFIKHMKKSNKQQSVTCANGCSSVNSTPYFGTMPAILLDCWSRRIPDICDIGPADEVDLSPSVPSDVDSMSDALSTAIMQYASKFH